MTKKKTDKKRYMRLFCIFFRAIWWCHEGLLSVPLGIFPYGQGKCGKRKKPCRPAKDDRAFWIVVSKLIPLT